MTVVTWLWGNAYGPKYVHKIARGLRRFLQPPYRFLCVTDAPEKVSGFDVDVATIQESDRHLLSVKGCFVRLRMFSPEWQRRNGITDRLVCIDLDTVITGPLDPLFKREEPFVILQGANVSNPCPYNGSLMMIRAGTHGEVWEEFSLERGMAIPYHQFPDDQGWIWQMVPGAAGWTCGPASGIWAFRKNAWPRSDQLPGGTRMVTFPGARDPSQFTRLRWVRQNW